MLYGDMRMIIALVHILKDWLIWIAEDEIVTHPLCKKGPYVMQDYGRLAFVAKVNLMPRPY
jgi:hypothetical protein